MISFQVFDKDVGEGLYSSHIFHNQLNDSPSFFELYNYDAWYYRHFNEFIDEERQSTLRMKSDTKLSSHRDFHLSFGYSDFFNDTYYNPDIANFDSFSDSLYFDKFTYGSSITFYGKYLTPLRYLEELSSHLYYILSLKYNDDHHIIKNGNLLVVQDSLNSYNSFLNELKSLGWESSYLDLGLIFLINYY